MSLITPLIAVLHCITLWNRAISSVVTSTWDCSCKSDNAFMYCLDGPTSPSGISACVCSFCHIYIMEVCFFSQMNRGPLNGNTFLKVCTVSVGNIHLINRPNGFQASSSACKAFRCGFAFKLVSRVESQDSPVMSYRVSVQLVQTAAQRGEVLALKLVSGVVIQIC